MPLWYTIIFNVFLCNLTLHNVLGGKLDLPFFSVTLFSVEFCPILTIYDIFSHFRSRIFYITFLWCLMPQLPGAKIDHKKPQTGKPQILFQTSIILFTSLSLPIGYGSSKGAVPLRASTFTKVQESMRWRKLGIMEGPIVLEFSLSSPVPCN